MNEVKNELEERKPKADTENVEEEDFLSGICRYNGEPEDCESCQ